MDRCQRRRGTARSSQIASMSRTTGYTNLICGQSLEQVDSALEKVDHLLLRLITDVAVWVESGIACTVLVPFVLPEGLVISVLILPVYLHEVEDIIAVGLLQDTGDIVVLARLVAVLGVRAIAVVRPGCK